MNGINARAFALDHFSLCARDNQNVLVVLRSILDVVDLFVDVALHAAAERRIELR